MSDYVMLRSEPLLLMVMAVKADESADIGAKISVRGNIKEEEEEMK